MKRLTRALLVLSTLAIAAPAFAQDIRPVEHRVIVTVAPVGATFFTKSTYTNSTYVNGTTAPSFSNYGLGGAVAVNFTRNVGVEGEFGGTLGLSQSLTGFAADTKTPNTFNYGGNIIINAATKSSIVPYVAGGVGGLTMLEKTEVGVAGNTTFLTGNVGGGVKWYQGRWGLRGDYRFVTIKSKDSAPQFFGQDTRYGHRITGAVLLNLGK